MTSNESWRRLLDVGAAVGQATLTRANEIARGLMDDEPEARQRALQDLDELGRAGRRLGQQLAEAVRDGLLERVARESGSVEALLDLLDGVVLARRDEAGHRPQGAQPRAEVAATGTRAAEPAEAEGRRGPTSEKRHAKAKAKAKAGRSGSAKGSAKGGKSKKRHRHGHAGPAPERP